MDYEIDDGLRRFFPGMSDSQILSFLETAEKVRRDSQRISIFESDLSHAQIICYLGWDAFKEYLRVTVGTDVLDDDDFVALTRAVIYLREIENSTLYNALFSSASEPQSKKTVSARKKSYEKLVSYLENIEVVDGI